MKSDPDFSQYSTCWSSIYEAKNYDEGLAGYFLKKSHEWSERPYGNDCCFPKVLEVGAGTGIHIKHVRHKFDEYWMTDLNTDMLECAANASVNRQGRIVMKRENACELSFPDATFDRLIAAHVLEHLPNPHEVLREWARVLKPGGTLTLVLPCDPGMSWRFGRSVGVRKKFTLIGMEYDYWMAREHINPINNLLSFIRYYFESYEEDWRPLKIPSIDLNLFYICHILV